MMNSELEVMAISTEINEIKDELNLMKNELNLMEDDEKDEQKPKTKQQKTKTEKPKSSSLMRLLVVPWISSQKLNDNQPINEESIENNEFEVNVNLKLKTPEQGEGTEQEIKHLPNSDESTEDDSTKTIETDQNDDEVIVEDLKLENPKRSIFTRLFRRKRSKTILTSKTYLDFNTDNENVESNDNQPINEESFEAEKIEVNVVNLKQKTPKRSFFSRLFHRKRIATKSMNDEMKQVKGTEQEIKPLPNSDESTEDDNTKTIENGQNDDEVNVADLKLENPKRSIFTLLFRRKRSKAILASKTYVELNTDNDNEESNDNQPISEENKFEVNVNLKLKTPEQVVGTDQEIKPVPNSDESTEDNSTKTIENDQNDDENVEDEKIEVNVEDLKLETPKRSIFSRLLKRKHSKAILTSKTYVEFNTDIDNGESNDNQPINDESVKDIENMTAVELNNDIVESNDNQPINDESIDEFEVNVNLKLKTPEQVEGTEQEIKHLPNSDESTEDDSTKTIETDQNKIEVNVEDLKLEDPKRSIFSRLFRRKRSKTILASKTYVEFNTDNGNEESNYNQPINEGSVKNVENMEVVELNTDNDIVESNDNQPINEESVKDIEKMTAVELNTDNGESNNNQPINEESVKDIENMAAVELNTDNDNIESNDNEPINE